MTTVEGTKVRITPEGEVSWNIHDTADGRLFIPLATNGEIDPLLVFQAFNEQPTAYRQLGKSGGHGVVKDVAGYALKHFYSKSRVEWDLPQDWIPGHLPDLRANVALAEGLSLVPQLRKGEFDVRAAEIHGAFIPHDWHGGDSEILWLMEKLDPIEKSARKELLLPEKKRRKKLYAKALELMSIDLQDVSLDDHKGNILITEAPSADKRGTLVRIDIKARPGKLMF
jgi:hypothetical protein